jgi:Ca2+-binding RTX toxin-like protein
MHRLVPALLTAAVAAAAIAVGAGLGGTSSGSDGTVVLNGRKVFPIVLAKGPDAGTTTPDGADALAEVAGGGVTFLKVGPATTPWTSGDIADANTQDRAAAAAGLSTWVNLSTVAQATAGSSGDTLLQQVVTSLKADAGGSAIAMWKGADEPLWAGIAPSALQFAFCRSTGRGDSSWCGGEPTLDDEHQWVTIEAPRGTAAQLQPYTAVTDVHGVDVYPVTLQDSSPDLHDVGTWTKTIASVTPSQAVWTTLQVCDTASYDTSGRYVLPTLAQERYMAYDAIVNGARSLAFYGGNIPGCWSASDRQYGWNWTFWSTVLKPLLAELNASSALAPALVSPSTTQVLKTNDDSTEAISRAGSGSDLWVIAARSGPGTQPVAISGLPSGITSGTVYTENRSVTVQNGSLTDDFAQWGVHVYRFQVPQASTTTAATTTTTAAPSGGGSGGTPNLRVTISPSATAVPLGQPVDFTIWARNDGTASSFQTHLAITLPAGLELAGSPYFERGSGCTGTQALDCFLDYVPPQTQTKVVFEARTQAAGAQTLTASVSADRDSDTSDNAASVTVDVAAPTPPAPPPPVPVKAPRTLAGSARADRLVGTAGADLLYGRGGNDTLLGGRGNDVLFGGAGRDVLDGGPGLDRLYGGPGNDVLKARDGQRDVVDCGPGRDVAYVDRRDRTSGCERVLRR